MKKYAFKLEPLLFKRQTEEEQARQKLAKENLRLKELENELSSAFEAYKAYRFQLDHDSIAPGDLHLYRNYVTELQRRLEIIKEQLRDQHRAVKAARENVLKMHKKMRVVEILKEKDIERYMKAVKREETLQLDEFTLLRHGRKPTR